jgi:hypothetical protein
MAWFDSHLFRRKNTIDSIEASQEHSKSSRHFPIIPVLYIHILQHLVNKSNNYLPGAPRGGKEIIRSHLAHTHNLIHYSVDDVLRSYMPKNKRSHPSRKTQDKELEAHSVALAYSRRTVMRGEVHYKPSFLLISCCLYIR